MELNYNRVELCGTVLEAPVLSHVNHGCAFCRFPLSVLRLSGQPDKLQVIAPQPLLDALPVSPGDTVTVTGQLRSFNNKSGQGSRLVISVFAQTLTAGGAGPLNRIQLSGILCKQPVLRRTPLGREIGSGVLAQPGEDEDRDMFEAACRRLEAEGYGRYEISNFARPGRESRHNLVYWRRGDYLGLGASAASCDGGRRWCNEADLEAYCRRMEAGAAPWNEVETLSEADKAFETLMLGLRLTRGIDRAAFRERFGYDCAVRFRPLLARWIRAGLAWLTGERLALTAAGLSLSGLSPDGSLVEMVELANHPWFVAGQFHPELKSRPNKAHPLFRGFVGAAKAYKNRHE